MKRTDGGKKIARALEIYNDENDNNNKEITRSDGATTHDIGSANTNKNVSVGKFEAINS